MIGIERGATASLWTTACLGIATVYNYVETNGYTVTSIEKQKRQSLQGKDAVLIIVLNKRCSHAEFINGLNENDSIHYIEEIR